MEPDKPRLTEAAAEAMCDRIMQRRLETDRAWRHAENADDQAAREAQITDEVWADITSRYDIR